MENAGGNANTRRVLGELLSSNVPAGTVGLLLQNRVKNTPLEVAPILYTEVLKDLRWSAQQRQLHGTGGVVAPHYHKYMMIVPCCDVQPYSATSSDGGNHAMASNRRKRSHGKHSRGDALLFVHFENEFFAREAELVHRFHGSHDIVWPDYGKVPVQYMVLVISHDAFVNALQK
uniref:Protein bcp1 n=1 Tax=Lygus hesperus TaxID=30085 RepID=A0A0A9Y554_LYGHE